MDRQTRHRLERPLTVEVLDEAVYPKAGRLGDQIEDFRREEVRPKDQEGLYRDVHARRFYHATLAAVDELRVTVVVPTRDRLDSLRRCVEALRRQTLGDSLEIVVVQDGGDQPGLEDMQGLQVVRQERRGPGAARNHGVSVARAPIVCFTDDDCEPLPDWAERFESRIAAGADAAIGRTVNADTRSATAAASQLVVSHLVERSVADGWGAFGSSNNFACRTEVFRQVQFDPTYAFAGGDRDWCFRMRAAGHDLAYVPSAIVLHRQRLTFARFLRQQLAYGRGSCRYRGAHGAWRPERPGFYGSLLAEGFASGPRVGALVALGQAATAVGYAREAVAGR
jgi:GT2 family glycosyltransferase